MRMNDVHYADDVNSYIFTATSGGRTPNSAA